MREAPSLTILPALIERGATIRAHDPQGMKEAKKLLPDLVYCSGPYEACEGSDAVVLLTEWREYRALDLQKLKKLLKKPVFVDLRNVYRRKQMEEAGFIYYSVGRKPVIPKGDSQVGVCK
jgi:UDPglucose 6-dehydrogenase